MVRGCPPWDHRSTSCDGRPSWARRRAWARPCGSRSITHPSRAITSDGQRTHQLPSAKSNRSPMIPTRITDARQAVTRVPISCVERDHERAGHEKAGRVLMENCLALERCRHDPELPVRGSAPWNRHTKVVGPTRDQTGGGAPLVRDARGRLRTIDADQH
jgi:hypothetical protein